MQAVPAKLVLAGMATENLLNVIAFLVPKKQWTNGKF